jgi:hypothetical protein
VRGRPPIASSLAALAATVCVLALPVVAQGPALATTAGVHLSWRPDLGEAGQYSVLFHSNLPAQAFDTVWVDANGTEHAAPIVITVPDYGGGSSAYGFRFPADATGYRVNERSFTLRGPPPAAGDAVRVAWVADVGRTSDTAAVLDAARAAGASAILAGGDLSYADGDDAAWDAWFTFMEPYIADTPFIPARGNHEGRCLPVAAQNVVPDCTSDETVYLDRFDLPLGELYYATQWGPLRIVVLDSEAYYPREDPLGRTRNTDPEEQRAFLADALRAPDGVWEIVMFHRPMYSSSGAHGSEFAIRDHLRATLEEGDADLVLAGHDHDYERTHVLLDDAVTSAGNVSREGDGVRYLVSGGGGQSLYASWQPSPAWSAMHAAEFHFLLIEATPGRLDVSAVRPDGTVLDRVSILAEPPAPADEAQVPWLPAGCLAAGLLALAARRRR